MPRNPNCRNCGLWKGAVNVCVWGTGPENAEVVAIGEAPGEAEAKTGRPFMGRSGQLLRSELSKAHLGSVYITNIVKCRPPDNRTPTPEEIRACRPYLDEELATVKPKAVLTLGAPASKTVLKKAKITEAHGQLVQTPNFLGFPAYHPAYCLRDPSKLPAFQHDLSRLRRTLDGKVWDSEVEWELVTRETLRQFVAEFQQSREFSFDLETSGLFPFDGQGFIRCVGFGLPERAWVLPLEMPGSPFAGKPLVYKLLMEELFELAQGKVIVAHNGKFDNHWLYTHFGRRFRLSFDTMLAHHVLDENQPHDLKYLARSYLDVAEYDLTTAEKKGKVKAPHVLYRYNAKDVTYTLRLYRIFRKSLRQDETQWKLFNKLVMPAARAFSVIEQDGLTLNLEKMAAEEKRILEKRDRLHRELDELTAPKVRKGPRKKTNWNSPQQVAKILYEDLELPVTERTDKGAPSTSEKAVIDLKGKHPVVDRLIAYREAAKFHSTYIEGFRELMVNEKLYISYKLHGTVTGRYSSRIHSIPRDGSIRNLVTAPPGWTFCQGDFSQAELRIAAILSGDLELRRCFAPGGPDVHWSTLLHTIESGASGEYVKTLLETASKAEGKKVTSVTEACEVLRRIGHEAAIEIWGGWKEGRKRAKAINFGFIYGMFEEKFIETCKVKYGFEPTFEEAHAFRTAYFTLYRGIPRWHERTKKLVHLNGFVRSLSGRLRRLPGVSSSDRSIRSEAERQAINSPVQGFIGDLKAMALVEIHETIPRGDLRIVGEHHDALLMIVRDGPQRNPTLRKVKTIMRHPSLLDEFGIELSVPIEADLELGPWGAGKAWKDDA